MFVFVTDYKLNAVMAKSRAMYGQSLTENDYLSLLNSSNIYDVYSFLKNRTIYSSAFSGIPEIKDNTSYLEFIVKKYSFKRFMKLCNLSKALGDSVCEIFRTREEINQILACVRNILLNNPNKYMLTLPEFANNNLTIDLFSMGKADTLEEIVSALESTPYESILKDIIKNGKLDYFSVEAEFMQYYEKYELETVKKHYKGKDRKEFCDYLCLKNDISIMLKLYRIKKYFPNVSFTMGSLFSGVETCFKRDEMISMCTCGNEKELLDIIKGTKYKAYAPEIEKSPYAEMAAEKILFRETRHSLRFSTNPMFVLYCYKYLSDIEVQNIIHIAEGIKFHSDTEKIKNMIIGI